MLSSPPWIYLWLKEYYLGRPMLKYWQRTIGLVSLCQWHMIASYVGKAHQCKTSEQQASPSGPPQKKHQNIFSSRTHTQSSTHFPLGSHRQVTAVSKQSCGFLLHPVLSRSKGPWDWTQPAAWRGDHAADSYTIGTPALLPRAVGRARQCSILTSLVLRGRGWVSGAGGSCSSAEAGAKFCWF